MILNRILIKMKPAFLTERINFRINFRGFRLLIAFFIIYFSCNIISMVIINGFLNININNVNQSLLFSPNLVNFFFNIGEFCGPPFKNGVSEIHPKIISHEIGWFDPYFCSFNE